MQTVSIKKQTVFARVSKKVPWKEILAILMLLLAVVFFRSERKEFHAIIPQIKAANPLWLMAGINITLIFIFFEAGMYKTCFSAIGLRLNWANAIILFLKRNFASVFLPAGGVSVLAYSPSELRKLKFNQSQIYQAGGLFGFAGIVTIIIAGLPVIIYTILSTGKFKTAWVGLVAVFTLIAFLIFIAQSIRLKGRLYLWIHKRLPSFTPALDEIFAVNVNARKYTGAILFSIGVEICGMVHLYIAMLALGLPASFGAAAAGYIISVLMIIISPFLRGLGAVELALVFVLEQFGYSSVHALSISVLYRVFEFWMPLLAGMIAFAWKGRKIFLRIAPALFTFLLGVVNIISVITPPLHDRTSILREYLPLQAIHASNMLVLFMGLALLITSAFLIRGLRNAWVISLALSLISFVGHLTKALDYEEALMALTIVIILIATVQQYRIRSSYKWMNTGLRTVAAAFIIVLVLGFISFYFINARHFGVDFTWQQSLLHTFGIFLLTQDSSLHPITRFGHEFILLIRCLGFLTWAFVLFSLFIHYKPKLMVTETLRKKSLFILNQYGNSSNDYFKLSKDKLIFISDLYDAFIAYRISGAFAIVLEEPVCAAEHKLEVLREFDLHCRVIGLKPAYYRVAENSIPWFSQLKKQKILIGQEAILDVKIFSLEGKDKKSLRNGLSSLQKKGYVTCVYPAPQNHEFIERLKNVSDEWLKEFEIKESTFSQGMFDKEELMMQDIIALEDENKKIFAFLNIIPDYAEDECTYDLIRKTKDAPGAAMDALIIKLIEYAKEQKMQFINFGLAPMTGIYQPGNTAEQIIKFASEKIKKFQHYKGLREFKEKYATLWENKYLIYDNDFDLLQLPKALNDVMRPDRIMPN